MAEEPPVATEPVLPGAHDHAHEGDEHGHPHEHQQGGGVLKTLRSCGYNCARCLDCTRLRPTLPIPATSRDVV